MDYSHKLKEWNSHILTLVAKMDNSWFPNKISQGFQKVSDFVDFIFPIFQTK